MFLKSMKLHQHPQFVVRLVYPTQEADNLTANPRLEESDLTNTNYPFRFVRTRNSLRDVYAACNGLNAIERQSLVRGGQMDAQAASWLIEREIHGIGKLRSWELAMQVESALVHAPADQSKASRLSLWGLSDPLRFTPVYAYGHTCTGNVDA